MLNSKICAPFVVSVVLLNLIGPCWSQPSSFGYLNNYPPSGASAQITLESNFNPYGGMNPGMSPGLAPGMNPGFPGGMGGMGGMGGLGGMGGMGGMGSMGGQGSQAFLDLLAPIQPPLFPPNLIAIKSKLCDLIMSNQLEVGPVMDYLIRFQHLDRFDFMIAALLALRDTLPMDCPLRQELGQLIVHSIFKRCQARLLGDGNSGQGPRPPMPPPPPPQPRPQRLSCETIVNMLNYFQSLFAKYNCQQCGSANFPPSAGPYAPSGGGFAPSGGGYSTSGGGYAPSAGGLPPSANSYPSFMGGNSFRQFTKRNSQQAQRRRSVELNRSNLVLRPLVFPYEQVIATLPQPQNEMEKIKYNMVKTFMKSDEMTKYLKNFTASDYSNTQKLLILVLQKVVESNESVSIREAFSYYLQKSQIMAFDYSTLIELVPQPLDAEEKAKFQIIKSFLSRKDIYQYLTNIDMKLYADKKLLFKSVFKTLAASKLDIAIVEAFKYYANYQDSLSELELYTKKEITKHFELTKIFIDTLDIDSLSSDAKLAFKKFFKFISNVTKDQIKDFDSWSEVKTKGEFMKALFRYFRNQTFVPQDIKEAIVKLEPLVKMVGRGAAPP